MASRPPDDARTRWFVMNATRLIGVVIALAGLLGLGGRIAIPDAASYGFIAFGLFDIFVVPMVLAKKWRTPEG